MKIDNLKDLSKLIALCRKSGIDAIKIDNIELHLGKLPLKASSRPKAVFQAKAPEEDIQVPQFNGMPITEPKDDVETDELTEEQLLFYSAQGEAN